MLFFCMNFTNPHQSSPVARQIAAIRLWVLWPPKPCRSFCEIAWRIDCGRPWALGAGGFLLGGWGMCRMHPSFGHFVEDTRPSKHRKSYWKRPIEIVDLPIKKVMSHSYVSLPEGMFCWICFSILVGVAMIAYNCLIRRISMHIIHTLLYLW